MKTIRLIIVASTIASASIVGADGVAATRVTPASQAQRVAKTPERLPPVVADASVAVSRVVPNTRRSEERPGPRTCPERSWPYGAARCVAQGAGVRVIALDAAPSTASASAGRPTLREAL